MGAMDTGLGFGVAVSLQDGFTGPADDIEAKYNELERTIDSNSRKIEQSTAMMTAGFQVMGAGLAVLAPVGLGLKFAAEFENAEVKLTTLLKSKEAAQEALANIAADAANTPFQLKELLAVNAALISTGLDAKNARADTLNLANAVAAVGGGSAELERMAVNMQGIRNIGKASSMDIKQFGLAGINIYGLLAEATGKSIKQVQEMDVSYELLSQALGKAAAAGGMYENALDNMSKTMSGKYSTLMDNIEMSLAALGRAIMPIIHPIIDGLTIMFGWLQTVMDSPFGPWLAGIIVLLGVLLVTLGGLLIVMGFVKGATYRLSTAFITMGATEIGTTFATAGLTAGMWALAVAVWAALAPIIPFIAAGLAIAAVVYGIYKALEFAVGSFNEFADSGDKCVDEMGPLMLFFTRLGGIITAVMEIWESATMEGFALSQKTKDALEALGILDFVVTMGTWLVRLKALLWGAGDSIAEVWGKVSSIFDKAWGTLKSSLLPALEKLVVAGAKIFGIFGLALEPLFDLLGLMGNGKGSMDAWRIAGTLLMDAFLMPFSVAIDLISYGLQGLIGVVSFIITLFSDLVDAVYALLHLDFAGFAAAGKRIVEGIGNGIMGAWDWLKGLIISLVGDLPFGDAILSAMGVSTGDVKPVSGGPTNGSPLQQAVTNNKIAGSRPVVMDKTVTNTSLESINLNVSLDSDPIHKAVIDKEQFNNGRK